MHVQGDAVVDHWENEGAHRCVDFSQSLLAKSVPENNLETKLSAHPYINLLCSKRPYRSSDVISAHRKIKICTSNEFPYKMKGKITGWGEFKTCPKAPGPNNCTIRCIKWTFLLTVMCTLICWVKWKLWNKRAAWLFINKDLNTKAQIQRLKEIQGSRGIHSPSWCHTPLRSCYPPPHVQNQPRALSRRSIP